MANIDPSTFEAVNNNNLKNIGEAPAWYQAQAFSQFLGHQNRVNVVAEQLLGAWGKSIVEMDPTQAVSQLKTLTGDDMAQKITNLAAALASNQQGAKVAQTTPPVTP